MNIALDVLSTCIYVVRVLLTNDEASWCGVPAQAVPFYSSNADFVFQVALRE